MKALVVSNFFSQCYITRFFFSLRWIMSDLSICDSNKQIDWINVRHGELHVSSLVTRFSAGVLTQRDVEP